MVGQVRTTVINLIKTQPCERGVRLVVQGGYGGAQNCGWVGYLGFKSRADAGIVGSARAIAANRVFKMRQEGVSWLAIVGEWLAVPAIARPGERSDAG